MEKFACGLRDKKSLRTSDLDFYNVLRVRKQFQVPFLLLLDLQWQTKLELGSLD